MADDSGQQYPDLLDDQMLAIGIYGEVVAGYRYTVLAEKLPDEADRRAFAAIAGEEQSHKERLQALFDRYYPDSAFYLSEDDKALVVSGTRLIDVKDVADYREVMRMALETEIGTARFYQAMTARVRNPEIRAAFQEMARESFDHHRRLTDLARQRGFLPPKPG
jgi:rubrerythrin